MGIARMSFFICETTFSNSPIHRAECLSHSARLLFFVPKHLSYGFSLSRRRTNTTADMSTNAENTAAPNANHVGSQSSPVWGES